MESVKLLLPTASTQPLLIATTARPTATTAHRLINALSALLPIISPVLSLVSRHAP